jgi:hypothetical protein
MIEETYNDQSYEYNDVWHPGRGNYYYNGYLYSGSAPGSHIPGGSAPSAPSAYGSITVAGIPLNYTGNPNFTNYAYINPEAILDEKCPKPPEPSVPNPTTPPETPAPPATPVQQNWGNFFKGVRNGFVSGIGWGVSVATAPAREVVNNVSTVYNNVRATGSGRIKSASVAVAAQAARLTGVENISYAWDGTDPVTGEQYSAGWRAAYAILGAGELVASAFGIKAIGEGAIQGGKGMLKSNVQNSEGGVNLFKWNSEQLGKQEGWQTGDRILYLPDQEIPKLNWFQNSSRLREEMRKGKPIYDSYIDPVTHEQIKTTGFLNAERYLLESRGWRYDPSTGAYHPPTTP